MQLKWTTRLAIVGAILSIAVVVVGSCRKQHTPETPGTTATPH